MGHKAKLDEQVGRYFDHVELETCRDAGVSRPRVRALGPFDPSTRVEFPRKLREMFPIGTRFIATVKVCQKWENRKHKGPPYLRASDISVVASSVPDEGLMARVRRGSISGLAYEYVPRSRS